MKIQSGTKLCIATPCYGAMLHAGYVQSLLRTSHDLTLAGMDHVPAFIPGDSLVTRARNVLVAQFLAGDCTHLMFIDGDIQWESADVFRLLAASSKHEVCCGVYPKKCVPLEFPMSFVSGSDVSINQDEDTGYIEIKDAPTGFLLIRRSVFAALMEEYPDLKCELRQDTPPAEAPFEYAFFDTFIDTNRRYLSEDYGFSRLWQAAGGRIWMDPEISLKHYGQYCYQGNIATALEATAV